MKLFQSDLNISPLKALSIFEEKGLVEQIHIYDFINGIYDNSSVALTRKKYFMRFLLEKIKKLSVKGKLQRNFYVPILKEHKNKPYIYFYPLLQD